MNNLMDELSTFLKIGNKDMINQVSCVFSLATNFLLVASPLMCLSPKLKRALQRNQTNERKQFQLYSKSPLPALMADQMEKSDEAGNTMNAPDDAQDHQVLKNYSEPTDAAADLPVEDTNELPQAVDLLQGWRCIGASVTGTSHADTDGICQDHNAHYHLPTGELLITVADGAGSAAFAAEGAELACHVALNYLKRQMLAQPNSVAEDYHSLIYAAFEKARSAIFEVAQERKIAAKEFATTLIIMILTPEITIGGMVGDGMAVVEYVTGEFECLFKLPRREYANQMVPIVSSRALQVLQVVGKRAPVQSVSVLTDGLLSLCCDLRTLKPFPPFFKTMTSIFNNVVDHSDATRELEIMLNHPLINEKTEDDKTLVMAKAIRVANGNSEQSDDGDATPIADREPRTDEDIRSQQQDVYCGEQVA